MARYTAGGGRWYVRPGSSRRYLSVTTIIDLGIPKPALIGWAAKVTAEHAVDNLDKLYALSRAKDAEDEEAVAAARQGAIDWLKGERYRSVNRAADKGSIVHEAIEAYKLQRPYPGVPPRVKPYYDAFVGLLEKHQPVILQTEANVFNEERRYAGTLDSIGVWPSLAERIPEPWSDERGPVVLCDYKTGSGVWPEAALQLAAYRNATFIDGPDGSEIPIPTIDGTIVIHLQEGWCEIIPVETGEDVFRHFLHAYETARWSEETSKAVIHKPWDRVEAKVEEVNVTLLDETIETEVDA